VLAEAKTAELHTAQRCMQSSSAKMPLLKYALGAAQVIADAFDLPLSVPAEVETAALGAALQAAAVHAKQPVGAFVAQHAPAMSGEVRECLMRFARITLVGACNSCKQFMSRFATVWQKMHAP
jgi:hypothetical protein